jgi:membrane associated rhomboid family serine protease
VTDTPETDGASSEAIERLQRAHETAARRLFIATSGVLLASLGLWVVVDGARNGTVTFLIVGAALYLTVAAAVDWRRKQRTNAEGVPRDPAAAAAYLAAEAEAERHRLHIISERPIVTYALMACLIAIDACQTLLSRVRGATDAIDAAGLVKPLVRQGQWWRLLTGTFLHSTAFGHVHLWMNLVTLWVIGQIVEAYSPRLRVALIYLVAALTGGLTSLIVAPHQISIGASGAIMGLGGYLLVLAWRRPRDVPPWLMSFVRTTFGLTASVGVFGFRFVDNAAHVGGALGGVAVGLLTIPLTGALPDWRRWSLAGVAAVFVLTAGAGLTLHQILRLNAVATPPAVRVAPVTSARLRVVSTDASAKSFEVENLNSVPLEAWTIAAVSHARPDVVLGTSVSDVCCLDAAGPIPTHQSRREDASAVPRFPQGTDFVLTAVLFSDGSFEGSPADRSAIQLRRSQQADDLGYEVQSITEALGQPADRVAALLTARADARVRQVRAEGRSPLVDDLRALARSAAKAPASFKAPAQATVARLTVARAALVRRPGR